ncbi:MAG TPA: hypothetical protein VGY98_14790 [Verrucomicrobiae bacterium]|jgi:hypothetical protein|nr:hypothetical protein [Verrucomicrobiae bacterium]
MFAVPANCPTSLVIAGAIITIVGWPVTACFAYRKGLRSQRARMEWEAQQAKRALRKKFIDLANRLKATVSVSERPQNWVDFFKDNVVQLISDYEAIRAELEWKEKKRIEEAMSSIRRFASMDHDEIYLACRSDSELADAFKKIPEA